jgi:hypothetical protein
MEEDIWTSVRLSTTLKPLEDDQPLTLRLEIPIDKAHQVEILKRRNHLGRVEPSILLRKALARPRLERAEELAAHAILHTEVEVVLRLERVEESNDERVVGGRENFLWGEERQDE